MTLSWPRRDEEGSTFVRILIINGSPRGAASSSLRIAKAFVEGLAKPTDVVDTIEVTKYQIAPCLSCYKCWYETPGVCVHKDDFIRLFENYVVKADLIVWSFPLFFYSLPAQLKAFIDRMFLLVTPEMVTCEDGMPSHPLRYDTANCKHIVTSTCGFSTSQGLYTAVLAQFRMIFRENFKGAICAGQGGVFAVSEGDVLVVPYLEKVRTASQEYLNTGCLSESTMTELSEPLLPREEYDRLANEDNAARVQNKG